MYVGDGTFLKIVEGDVAPRYPLKLHSLGNASSRSRDSTQIAEKDAMLLYQTEAGNQLYSVAQ